MPNRRAFLPARSLPGSIAGPIRAGMLLMMPAPPTATWKGRHWRAAANTGVFRTRAVGGDYKRRADFAPAGVLPKQTDPVGGAGVRSPRSRKRSLSSPVAVRKSVTAVNTHVVCALRSATPSRVCVEAFGAAVTSASALKNTVVSTDQGRHCLNQFCGAAAQLGDTSRDRTLTLLPQPDLGERLGIAGVLALVGQER